VKVIVVRDGSAILFSEFGQKPVKIGDVILLGANVLCGSEPEGGSDSLSWPRHDGLGWPHLVGVSGGVTV
jgi:hypothetical protein